MIQARTQEEIESALLDGGEIYVDSSSVIHLSRPLYVNKPTKFRGGQFIVSSGPALIIGSSNVDVIGTQIYGANVFTASLDESQKFIYAQGTQGAPLTNLSVLACRLYGSQKDNIRFEWCTDSIISSNLVKNFLYSGIMLLSCEGVTVTGNNVSNGLMKDPVKNVYGIMTSDLDNTEAARSRNISITGNRVHQIDWEAIDTHGGDGITITGNTVTASPRGIALVSGNLSRLTVPTRCVVTGNNIDASGSRIPSREGIWLGGISGNPACGVVTGNYVSGYEEGKSIVTPLVDRNKLYVGGNNISLVPASLIELNSQYFSAHNVVPPRYTVDGNSVSVEGAVFPKPHPANTSLYVGKLSNPHAWPERECMLGMIKGSNPNAGTAMLGIKTNGELWMYYKSTNDTYPYHLAGSYLAR